MPVPNINRCILLTALVGLTACELPSEGLRFTPEGTGPLVLVDWDAKPLPEIPFPNDLATRADPTSITGLRLNISEEAPTEIEREARQKLNEFTGFGIYAPITVAFEAPLDLDVVASRHLPDGDMTDDAIYIVDVTPDSPTYLQAVELDLGHGRFPMDVEETDRYFTNDPLAGEPSLIFDTRDEDTNGNGLLEPSEDTDGDGYLDVPNVYPEGGDAREDLLTWYEKLTNTLIVRPIVPLREETTYAVILTERLLGVDGEPIRSPWNYINHTRQTDALQPLFEALPILGLDLEEVGYTWAFTTGRITGDLVDIRRGLNGEGPWPFLDEEYPGGVFEASVMHNLSDEENVYALPFDRVINILIMMDLIPEESAPIMQAAYDAFTQSVVGGAFTSLNLMVDQDDGGYDDADEWWQLDPVAGTMLHEPNRIAFTCFLPKETEELVQPFDVAIFGHGYKSSRLEVLGFSEAMNQAGFAVCTMDYPGHGPTMNEEEIELIETLMTPAGLYPMFEHLLDSRQRDLDNDGEADSGGDQWISDPFHTRDMVRQAAVDAMLFLRSLQRCGEGTMTLGEEQGMSCDWDGNGVPDVGGSDADFMMAGGSLGGINTAVIAAVEPELTASVSIVPGGGLMDVGARSPLPGVVEAVHGKLMTPMMLGIPAADGSLDVVQMVSSVTSMGTLHVANLPVNPAGGRVLFENLNNGEIREVPIPENGRFRVAVPADAADYFEKRVIAGMPLDGPIAGEVYEAADNSELGDLLAVSIWDAEGNLVAEIDTFDQDGEFEAVTVRAGSPLIALAGGLGHVRATPEYRRLIMFTAMATEPGDPISYAPHFFDEPFEKLGGQPINHLIMPTPGDMVVAINAGIALGRAAGLIDWHEVDERYGMSVDHWLIEKQVVRGMEEHGPYRNEAGQPILFDADDLDNGADGLEAPSEEPLRIVKTTSAGVSGFRLPYVKANGTHGFSIPDPTLEFDINSFCINQIGRYFQTRGQEINDDPCLATWDCEFMREME